MNADPAAGTAPGARFPFSPYPAGWYCVALGRDIPIGEAVALHYFGRELVAFRGEGGDVHVADAYCPHLGAHLAVGGTVQGDSIRCPFHHWRFDGADGTCVEVPYARRIPPRARIEVYPTLEWAGLVLAWYAGPGDMSRWTPDLPDCAEADWSLHEDRCWRVRTHVQEIGENGLDIAHVGPVHGSERLEITELREDGPVMCLATAPADPEQAQFKGVIRRTLWGLGLSMNEFVGEVESRVIISRTPVDAEEVEVRMVFVPRRYDDDAFTQMLGDALADRVGSEFEGDIAIWEHKTFVDSPVLCDGDGPINKWRNWSRQFY